MHCAALAADDFRCLNVGDYGHLNALGYLKDSLWKNLSGLGAGGQLAYFKMAKAETMFIFRSTHLTSNFLC